MIGGRSVSIGMSQGKERKYSKQVSWPAGEFCGRKRRFFRVGTRCASNKIEQRCENGEDSYMQGTPVSVCPVCLPVGTR